MTIFRFNNSSIEGLHDRFGISEIWVLTDESGRVSREVGFSLEGNIIHKYPSSSEFGRYGIFDGNLIEGNGDDDISLSKFDEKWIQL